MRPFDQICPSDNSHSTSTPSSEQKGRAMVLPSAAHVNDQSSRDPQCHSGWPRRWQTQLARGKTRQATSTMKIVSRVLVRCTTTAQAGRPRWATSPYGSTIAEGRHGNRVRRHRDREGGRVWGTSRRKSGNSQLASILGFPLVPP